MLLESAFGCWAVVMSMAFGGLNLVHPDGLGMAVAFVGGLPAYFLDGRSRRRIVVFLPALYLLRVLIFSWRADALLMPATILLQWWKLRSEVGAAAGSRARRAHEGTA